MDIDPSIAALRGNYAAQRRSQTILEAAKAEWLAGNAGILGPALTAYGDGEDLDRCAALARLFKSQNAAHTMIKSLIAQLGSVIAQEPLGQIPFRHQYRKGVGVLQLASAGRANVSLLLYEQKSGPPAQSIYFTDGECTEIVLSGQGQGRLFTLGTQREGPARLSSKKLRFEAGSTLSYAGSGTAKLVEHVPGCMIVLRLSRSPQNPQESREYRLTDGALVHRASGDRSESRQEMIVALLGAMKRRDAVPAIAAKCTGGTPHLRWQSIRQTLALDTALGFETLCKVADNPADELCNSAAALKVQLTEKYPQLSQLEPA